MAIPSLYPPSCPYLPHKILDPSERPVYVGFIWSCVGAHTLNLRRPQRRSRALKSNRKRGRYDSPMHFYGYEKKEEQVAICCVTMAAALMHDGLTRSRSGQLTTTGNFQAMTGETQRSVYCSSLIL